MIFYKKYNFTSDLNKDIKQNPEWFHEVVGFCYHDGSIVILVQWYPKVRGVEEFKHEQ